jgi:hypothetical protein
MEESLKLCLLIAGVVLSIGLSGYWLWVCGCRKGHC